MRLLIASAMVSVLLDGGCTATTRRGAATQPVPEFIGSQQDWLNSPPISLKTALKTRQTPSGKPVRAVLVDFWEYTCVNCIRTFPYLKEWHKRYADAGLLIVGIHTPEFEFGRDRRSVADAARRFGLEYPILLDGETRNWQAWDNHYWPRHILLDTSGKVVDDHAGEGGYARTEQLIQATLRRQTPGLKFPKTMALVRDTDDEGAVCYPVTPETYAGTARGMLGNPGGFAAGREHDYRDPGVYKDGRITLHGRWIATPEALIRAGDGADAYAVLRYHALEVNAVLRPEAGHPVRIIVTQDGKPVPKADRGEDLSEDGTGQTYMTVQRSRMYRIIRNSQYGSHNLALKPDGNGVGLYAYTFGSCTIAGPASTPRKG